MCSSNKTLTITLEDHHKRSQVSIEDRAQYFSEMEAVCPIHTYAENMGGSAQEAERGTD